jgi:membrane associated rhomboid family serine protease
MSDEEAVPPRKIIPIEEGRREGSGSPFTSPVDGPAWLEEPPHFEPAEPPPPGLWDRVGDIHPGFTYALVLAILVGFAAQLVTATVGLDRALTGGSLTGPFVEAGAAARLPFLAGEWWRLLAPLFLHANLLHLGSNLIALVLVGGVAERAYGHSRFLTIFIVAGAVASLATFERQGWALAAAAAAGAPLHSIGSIGASGAVYGVGAAVVAAAIRLRGLLTPWRARALIGATLPLLLSSLAGGFAKPGTDNAAHVGGAVAGAILGAFLPFHSNLRAEPEGATARTFWGLFALFALGMLVASGVLAFLHGQAAG